MVGRTPPQNEDTFHKARSRLIDAFARLEARLVIAIAAAGKLPKADTLATKLKTLREIFGAKQANDLALVRLNELIQFRADLVHGAMTFTDIDGERFASFRNARHAQDDVQRASLISYKKLKEMAEEIDRLSQDITA